MTMENVDARPPNKPKLVNPIKEGPNTHRQDLAKQVEAFYTSRYLLPGTSQLTDVETRIEWARLMNLPTTPQAAREGVLKLQELLDDSLEISNGSRETVVSLSSNPPLKFGDPVVSAFLLDIFRRDPHLTEADPTDRLNQIFVKVAHDLYGDRNNNDKSGLPSKDRVEKIKHHFTNNRLPAVIEFFLIEPALLPEIPKQRSNEK